MPELTKEEKKFLVKALWDALQSPEWTRDGIIEFGKAVFSKASFKDMSEKTFEQIFPFVEKITVTLGEKLNARAEEQLKKETPAEGGEKRG